MYVLDIDTILVERDGEKQRYVRGEDVSDAPADQLAAMVRLKQAVEHDPTQAAEPPAAAGGPPRQPVAVDSHGYRRAQDDPAADDGVQAVSGDWKTLPVASLELDEATRKLLVESQLPSVQAILDFGTEHGSLTTIDGIGEGREREIQAAITKARGE